MEDPDIQLPDWLKKILPPIDQDWPSDVKKASDDALVNLQVFLKQALTLKQIESLQKRMLKFAYQIVAQNNQQGLEKCMITIYETILSPSIKMNMVCLSHPFVLPYISSRHNPTDYSQLSLYYTGLFEDLIFFKTAIRLSNNKLYGFIAEKNEPDIEDGISLTVYYFIY